MNLGQRPSACSSIWDWFSAGIGSLSPTLYNLFLMLIHSIWRTRNALLWDGKLENLALVSYSANLQLDAFTKVQPTSQPQSLNLTSRWSPPPTAGSYVGGFVRQVSHVNNPYTVELLAARESLCWAMQRNCQSILVKTDALQVVQGVGSLRKGSSFMDLLMDDVQESLWGFGSSKIFHIPSSTNGTTYRLAKLALVFPSNFHWFEEPPDIIQDILFEDFMPSS
ncbi:hypothetical protein D8674_004041 [Pyrus ussuriensis x Pyrus communis]|uniref:RNase H type-1 domain-containing protein n=1 Tax=Pyrus ussuriensis x Pyrus communis TaxID=2448454 RepID=A0A5N5FIR6_9ROSA|nr:hypothetical protein D8674_004041 [Pyrus ussuriensis x Pyrus communis]